MTKSRICAFQLIYEYLYQHEYSERTFNILVEEEKLKEIDVRYLEKVYKGVIEKEDELEDIVRRCSLNFRFNRIVKADLALLYLAIYEMKYMPNIPPKVSINEVVDISKVYSTKRSSKYINGIMAAVYKEVVNEDN